MNIEVEKRELQRQIDTLLAKPVAGQSGAWAIEIHLQGEAETVFFDV